MNQSEVHAANEDGQHDEREDRSECPACYPTFPSEAEANRLLTTDRRRVVPAPREAMHIDGGNGHTLCGVRIARDHGTVEGPGRISCIRCGRLADAEANLPKPPAWIGPITEDQSRRLMVRYCSKETCLDPRCPNYDQAKHGGPIGGRHV